MNILLIGEYSRLHNSLKEGLLKLGHEVTIVGTGDGFKNYPVDIKFGVSIFNRPVIKMFTKIIHKIFKINLIEYEYAFRANKIIPKLKSFDVVQLIKENCFNSPPFIEKHFIKKIIKNNSKVFLLSSGADYTSIKYAFDEKYRYSIVTPYKNNINLKDPFILNYLKKPYKKLHEFLVKSVNGIIATDIDYHLPLLNYECYLGMIPNPINLEKLDISSLNIDGKIVIFHGVNRDNYHKKGNNFFAEALKIIHKKHSELVTVITTENVPYKEYITSYNKAHIVLDQVYAYDQGYNALEAMAKGKVVFTGAEKEWLDYYELEEDSIAINALPDVDYLVEKLEWLILKPQKIEEISKKSRIFIEKEHHYLNIAEKYISVWNKN